MKKTVFHASPFVELEKIAPRESSHKEKYIYAARCAVEACLFLRKRPKIFSDFVFSIGGGRDMERAYIRERLPNALNQYYGGFGGSIYMLRGYSFLENKTSFPLEVVSLFSVKPKAEIRIKDSLAFLEQARDRGEIELILYGQQEDESREKEALLSRAVLWMGKMKPDQQAELKALHPHIYSEAQLLLRDDQARFRKIVLWCNIFGSAGVLFQCKIHRPLDYEKTLSLLSPRP